MFAWNPSLAIGVPAVDGQHQALFEHAARFEAGVKAAEPSARLEELFGFLADYVDEHFQEEERLMREIGYPGLQEHVQEHADFRRRVGLLEPLWVLEGDSETVLTVLIGFIHSWLIEHIGSSDQRLGAYVKAVTGTAGR